MITHQKSSVEIVNNTGLNLLCVLIAHKYSDVYKNDHKWLNIANGVTTSPAQVDFNTGFGTTGRDWWIVVWMDVQGNFYKTDPSNLRGVIDLLEVGLNFAMKIKTIIGLTSPEPTSKAAAAAGLLFEAIIGNPLNSESTSGFKQHILTKDDLKRPTKIILRSDAVEFDSESGSSTTGIKKRSHD